MRLLHLLSSVCAFFAREEGDTLSQIMWGLAFLVMAAVIAYLGGAYISPEWRDYVGNPTP